MIRHLAAVCLMAWLVIGLRPAAAQYMFLDTDGDGIHTTADHFACHDSINVDVVLVTTQTEYGVPSVCPMDGSGLDINSYTINLYTGDGPIRFANLTNRMPGMSPITTASVYPYALSVSYGGPLTFPPGTHRLFSFSAAFESGCSSIEIVPYTCYSPPGAVTSFGSSCPGSQGDYSLRLGEDWFGTFGTNTHSDPIGHWPSVTCPDEVVGLEGQPISFPVVVNDPDCGIWSFYAYGVPPGAAVTSLGPFVAGDATSFFNWTPGPGQAGTYAITFDASDYPNPFAGITQRDTCTTVITIRSTTAASGGDVAARVFSASSMERTRLPYAAPLTCFQIEPRPDETFSPLDVVAETVTLRCADPRFGTKEVRATESRPMVDADHNGVPEFAACFSREAMQTLGGSLSGGTHDVQVQLQGRLTDGSRFHGELLHRFVVSVGSLAAAITPNPLDRTSTLEFRTTRAGSMTARLFDIRGRFTGTLIESRSLEPGSHRMPLTSLEGLRDRLASGVYFIRVATEHDGSETKTVTVLK